MIKTSQKVANSFTYATDGCALIDTLMREGKLEDAHKLCGELLAESGNQALLINRAMVERAMGCFRLSLATLESVQTDDLQLLGNMHNGLGLSCWGLQRFDDGLIHYYGACDFYKQAGNEYYYARTLNNIGNCLVDLQRPDEAHTLIDRAEKDITDPPSLAHLQHTRARAFLAQDMLPEALHYAALSVSMLAKLGEVTAIKEPKEFLAELLSK